MKKTVLSAAAVLLVLLCGWRLHPRTLNEILSADAESLYTVSVHTTTLGISGGKPDVRLFALEIPSPEGEHFAPVLEILDGGYRPDFRNLLPHGIKSAGSGTENIAYSTVVTLTGETGGFTLVFHGDRTAVLSRSGETGLKVFHPADRAAAGRLAAYAEAHGTEQT